MKPLNELMHPDDVHMFIRIVTIGRQVAQNLGLPLQAIHPDDPSESYHQAHLGRCFSGAGYVLVTLRYKNRDGQWLGPVPEMEVWNTVAHELAHLRFPHHRKSFWNFMREVEKEVRKVRVV